MMMKGRQKRTGSLSARARCHDQRSSGTAEQMTDHERHP